MLGFCVLAPGNYLVGVQNFLQKHRLNADFTSGKWLNIEEPALVIPECPFNLAIQLGEVALQDAVIWCDGLHVWLIDMKSKVGVPATNVTWWDSQPVGDSLKWPYNKKYVQFKFYQY